jgi:hypothetical protein
MESEFLGGSGEGSGAANDRTQQSEQISRPVLQLGQQRAIALLVEPHLLVALKRKAARQGHRRERSQLRILRNSALTPKETQHRCGRAFWRRRSETDVGLDSAPIGQATISGVAAHFSLLARADRFS